MYEGLIGASFFFLSKMRNYMGVKHEKVLHMATI